MEKKALHPATPPMSQRESSDISSVNEIDIDLGGPLPSHSENSIIAGSSHVSAILSFELIYYTVEIVTIFYVICRLQAEVEVTLAM